MDDDKGLAKPIMSFTLSSMHWLYIAALGLTTTLGLPTGALSIVFLCVVTGVMGAYLLAAGRWDSMAVPAPLSSFFLLFGLWIVASTLWSAALFESWRAVTIWFLLPIWAWAIGSLKFEQFKQLLLGAFILLVALCLIGVGELGAGATASLSHYRAESVFSNPNVLASVIVILLLPLQFFWLAQFEVEPRRQLWDRLFLAIIIFVFAVLVLTASRIGMICYLTGTAILLGTIRGRLRANWKRYALFLGGLVVAYLGVTFFISDWAQTRFERVIDPVTNNERLLVWDTSWQSYLLQPFTGHGFGALFIPYAALRAHDDGTIGQFAHSDILQYLAEIGPIGLLLSFGIAGSFIWLSVKRLAMGFVSETKRLWFIGLSVAILANMAASAVTYIFYLPVILLLTALLLGGWSILFWNDGQEPNISGKRHRKRPLRALVFGGVMVLAVCIHLSSHYVVKADQSIRASSIKNHARYTQLANRLSLGLNPSVKLEMIDVALAQATLAQTPDLMEFISNRIEEMEGLQPATASLWLQKARFAIVQGQYEEAENNLNRALNLDPTYLPARLMLGKLKREQDDADAINAIYMDALRWRLTELKYGVFTMDELLRRENNLPRLLPAPSKSR